MHGKVPLGKLIRALGLMSGTSMDGIDVALIETDGESRVIRGPSAAYLYPPSFRTHLCQALEEARGLTDRAERPGILATVEQELTERHAEAVRRFLGEQALTPAKIEIVGFHGQTILHRPPSADGAAADPRKPMTVQLGDGPQLAKRLGIDVCYDLRAADVAAGGQGAPLVPAYQRALAARLPQRPVAFLNIGGIANVTWIGEDGKLIAFDTGPGNGLMDDWAMRHMGVPCDIDGATARRGTADEEVLRAYLLHPYFQRAVPKSLDRRDFTLELVASLSHADGAATLATLTATTIARSIAWFPVAPTLWVVAGGGRRNKYLMELLAGYLDAPVAPVEAVQLDGDALEAEAWAYLAVRSLMNLPITFPGTTGVRRPMTGGVVAKP